MKPPSHPKTPSRTQPASEASLRSGFTGSNRRSQSKFPHVTTYNEAIAELEHMHLINENLQKNVDAFEDETSQFLNKIKFARMLLSDFRSELHTQMSAKSAAMMALRDTIPCGAPGILRWNKPKDGATAVTKGYASVSVRYLDGTIKQWSDSEFAEDDDYQWNTPMGEGLYQDEGAAMEEKYRMFIRLTEEDAEPR